MRLEGSVLVAEETFPTYYFRLDGGVFRAKRDLSSALFQVGKCDLEAKETPINIFVWLEREF